MIKLRLIARPDDAPCCIKLELVLNRDGRKAYGVQIGQPAPSALIQTDWEWPAVAGLFDWSVSEVKSESNPTCEHDETDGTVKCPHCELNASDFIQHARQWIDDHDGETCGNPGYKLE